MKPSFMLQMSSLNITLPRFPRIYDSTYNHRMSLIAPLLFAGRCYGVSSKTPLSLLEMCALGHFLCRTLSSINADWHSLPRNPTRVSHLPAQNHSPCLSHSLASDSTLFTKQEAGSHLRTAFSCSSLCVPHLGNWQTQSASSFQTAS